MSAVTTSWEMPSGSKIPRPRQSGSKKVHDVSLDPAPLASLCLPKSSRRALFCFHVFREPFLGPLPAKSSLESADLPLLPLWPHCVLDILSWRTSTPDYTYLSADLSPFNGLWPPTEKVTRHITPYPQLSTQCVHSVGTQ